MKQSYLNSERNAAASLNPSKTIRLLLLVLFVGLTTLFSFGQTATFTTPGSQTWTCPAGVTSITVECWGGGGAGGAEYGSSSDLSGGGGSGGAYAKGTFTVTPGTTYNLNVGAGANVTFVSPFTASTPSASWFNTTSVIQAVAGKNAIGNNSSGTNSAGAAAVSSGNFNTGASPTNTYGGAGSVGSATGTGLSGKGGNGGNGGAGASGVNHAVGGAGTQPGGGGSGAETNISIDRQGGDGGDGEVIITWPCTTYALTSPATATSVCVSGSSTVTLTSLSLPDDTYTVTYSTTNPTTSNNTATMIFSGTTGTFSSRSLSATSTISVVSISSAAQSCSNTISLNNSATVTINPNTAISSQSTATQTQCITAAFSPITVTATGSGLSYQWYSNTLNSNTGGTSLASTNGAQTNSYTPQSTVAGTLYYYCIVTGTCGSAITSAVSGAFITNPNAAISSQSTATQTKCITVAFSPITVTATGSGLSYQWYSNASNSNSGGTSLASTNGAQTNSYTPQSTVAGTLYYYCIVTGTCGNATSAVSGAFITNPNTAISSQSTATQTQCITAAFSPITVTATGSGLSYQWYSNTLNSNTGGTSLASTNGAQTNSYTPQSTVAGTLYYYCIVTGTCGSAITSAVSGAFITNPNAAISSQSTATQTKCITVAFSPITVTATGSGLSYQWYSNASNSNSGGTSLASTNGAQTNSYTPQSTVAGTLYYYCIVTGTCGNATSAVSGAFITNPNTAISSQSTATQTQCITAAFSPITVTATGSGLSYQWYSNTLNSNTGGTSLASTNGAQTNSYTPQSTVAGTLYYYCIVTGTCGSAITSAVSGAFITNPNAAISSQSTATQTKCITVAFSPITVTATGSGLSYQWYSNASNSNSGGTSLAATNGAQTNSYTPQSTVAGTLYYYCIVTGTCGNATSAVSGAFITNPNTAISSQSTATQTQCITAAFSPITVTATGSGLSYQWYSNTLNSNTGGTSLASTNGAQTNSYTPQSTVAGTLYYYCIVTGTCGNATSAVSGAFITNPNTAISSQSTATQTKCITVAFSPITVTATGSGLSYQWYSNASNSNSGGTSLASTNGAQTNSYTPQSTVAGTLYYYCIVTGTCGNATSAVSGAFITNPNTAISSQSTATQTQCITAAFSPITVTATGSGLSYQWYSNTLNSNTGGTLLASTNGAQTNSYTPQSTVAGTLYYYCIATGTCGSAITSAVSGAFITNPNTAISSQSTATQTQCITAAFSPITVTATGSGLSYQWYSNTLNSNTGGTSLASTNGAQTNSYTPQSTVAGTLYYYCIVTGTCGSAITSAVSGAFITNPNAAISSQSTATQTKCITVAFSPITVTATGSGLSYQWYSNASNSNSGGTSLAATNGAQTNSYTPQSTVAGTLYYYCIVTGTCGNATSAVSGAFITNPNTAISSQSTATQTQCITAAFSPITVTATGSGLSYQWYSNTLNSNTGGTSLASTNGAQTNSYTPQSTVAGTLYYYCIVTGTCGSAITSAVSGAFITNPNAAISSQSTATQTKCITVAFSPITVTATGSGLSYQWYSNASNSNSGGTSLASTNGAQTNSYTPQSTVAGTLYYYCVVTGTCGNATSAVSGAFITNPNTAISSQSTATQTQCITAAFSPITVTATGSGLSYQWYSNASNSNTGGTSLASTNGAQTNSYTPQSTVAGTLYYYCIVTGTCGSAITSAVSGAFITNPTTAISSQSTATQTQCITAVFSPITVTATGSGLSYQWYSNTLNSNTGGTSLASTNGAQTNSYTPQSTVAGTLYYYCIVTGTCGSAITSAVSGAFITNANMTAGAASSTPTLCISTALTSITHTTTLATGISNDNITGANGLPAGVQAHWASNTITISGTPIASGNFIYSIPLTGGCGSVSATGTITVIPLSNGGTISGASTPICQGSSTGTLTLSGQVGSVVQWEKQVNSGGWSNIGNGGFTTYTEVPYSAGTWQYRALVQNGSCSSVYSAIQTIIVDPTPVGGGIYTGNTPICNNSSTGAMNLTGYTGSVVQWEKRLNGGSWVIIANTTATYSESPSVGGTWDYRALVDSGSCAAVYSTSFSVVVNPTLTITLGANPVVCANTLTASIPYSATTGSPAAWVLTFDSGAHLAGFYDQNNTLSTAPSNIIVNVPYGVASGVYNANLTVITYYPSCSSVAYPVTVTVTANTDISSQSTATQTQCITAAFSPITVTATGSGLSYQWYSNTSNANSGGTSLLATNGAQTNSYTPQSTVAGTLYYYCVVTGTCGSAVTSAVSGAFITNPNTAISSQSTATQTQCITAAFSPITVTAIGSGLSYQWYSNALNSNSGGTSLLATNGAQTNSYTPQSTVAGTLYYYCIVTGTCGSAVTSAVSGAFITNPNAAISSQSTATQTKCITVAFSPITVTATGSGLSYQWYSNASNSNSGGTSLLATNGAQTNTYTPQSTVAGTLYYYCIVTGTCGNATSAVSGAFITNPNTAISSQSTATQTQCITAAFSPITVTATGSGLSYQWYSNTLNSNTGGTSLAATNGAQTNSYTPQSTVAGTLYYYCIVTGTCGSAVTSAVSGAFITNPNAAISSQSTATRTKCITTAFSPITVTATGSGLSYQWYSNTLNSNSGGTSLLATNGAQTNSYTPQSTVAGTLYYYCVVTGTCGNATSAVSGAFITNPNAAISSQSTATQTKCITVAFSPITVTATGSGLSYQWYSNASNSNTGGTSLASTNGARTNSYTPQSTVAGTLYYYCIVTGTCGSAVTSAVSGAFITNANAAISSQSTATQTQCITAAFSPITVTATGSGLSYQWYSNTLNSNTGGTSLAATNGAQTNSYTPQSTVAGTLYYYCIVTGTCGSAATSAVSGAFITNANNTVGTASSSPNLCISTLMTSVTHTTTGATGISNDNVTGANGLPAGVQAHWASNTITISGTPSASGTFSYSIPLTGGCGSVNAIGTITVNAAPTIAAITAPATLCSASSLNPTAPTVTANGSAVTASGWQLEVAVGIGAFAPLTVPYTVSLSDNGKKIQYYATNSCGTTTSNQVVLTINAVPSIPLISTPAALCSGDSLNPTTPTVTFNSSSLTASGWQLETSVGSGTCYSISVPYTVSYADNGKRIQYYASNSCGTSYSNPVTLTVNPTLSASVAIAASPSGAICSGTSVTFTATPTNGGSSPAYQWYKGATPMGGATSSTYTTTALSNGDVVTCVMTSNASPCLTASPATSAAITMIVNALPSAPITATPIQPDCVTLTGSVVLSGLPTGTWTINPGGITGSTTSTTVSGLSSGTYNFTVTSASGCTSSASSNVVINSVIINTWNGSTWSNGKPSTSAANNQALIFAGNYPPSPDPNVDLFGCSCTVNSGVKVTINSGLTMTIANTVTVLGSGSLIFDYDHGFRANPNNTATLLQTNNVTNTGNISYNRMTNTSIISTDYTYWSSPVMPQTLGQVSQNLSLPDFYYSYDSTIDDWQQASASTSMVPGLGYIFGGPKVINPGSFYLATFNGVPNNGDITISSGIGANSSFLLGNPYPSALSADSFLIANNNILDGTLYFWTHNTGMQDRNLIGSTAGSGAYAYTQDDYASYNLSGGVGTATGANRNIPTGFIAAGQGFFGSILATPTSGSIVYTNDMRVAGSSSANSQFFKTSHVKSKTTATIEKDRVWLNLTNTQGAFKQTLVGYITGATNDYDNGFDGLSYDGNQFLDFYSVLQDMNLTIQGRAVPFDENDVVPLGYRTTIDGDFTINIDQVDGLLADHSVFIEDKLTNKVTDLKSGNYTFTTAAGTFNDRFVLKYTNVDKNLSVAADKADGIMVFYSNNYNTLIIHNSLLDSTVNTVTLYNMAGQKISNWDVSTSDQTNIQIPIKEISSGVYIVKVKTTNGESNKKIIVN